MSRVTSNIYEDLKSALVSGFIDHSQASKHDFKPQLLVNDGKGKKF